MRPQDHQSAQQQLNSVTERRAKAGICPYSVVAGMYHRTTVWPASTTITDRIAIAHYTHHTKRNQENCHWRIFFFSTNLNNVCIARARIVLYTRATFFFYAAQKHIMMIVDRRRALYTQRHSVACDEEQRASLPRCAWLSDDYNVGCCTMLTVLYAQIICRTVCI